MTADELPTTRGKRSTGVRTKITRTPWVECGCAIPGPLIEDGEATQQEAAKPKAQAEVVFRLTGHREKEEPEGSRAKRDRVAAPTDSILSTVGDTQVIFRLRLRLIRVMMERMMNPTASRKATAAG